MCFSSGRNLMCFSGGGSLVCFPSGGTFVCFFMGRNLVCFSSSISFHTQVLGILSYFSGENLVFYSRGKNPALN